LHEELERTTPATSVRIPTFGHETGAEGGRHKIITVKHVHGDVDEVLDLEPEPSKKRRRLWKIRPPDQDKQRQENQSETVTLAPDRGSVVDQWSVN
jgi:hypothetical protein